MARLKIVLWPVLMCRFLLTSLGLAAMATAGWLAPYKTAGAKPLTRRRRASFLPRDSRSSAVTVISFLILLTPNFYLYLPRGARTRACRVETRLDACPKDISKAERVEMSLDTARTSACATSPGNITGKSIHGIVKGTACLLNRPHGWIEWRAPTEQPRTVC